jgi:hypothetical protein
LSSGGNAARINPSYTAIYSKRPPKWKLFTLGVELAAW